MIVYLGTWMGNNGVCVYLVLVTVWGIVWGIVGKVVNVYLYVIMVYLVTELVLVLLVKNWY